MQDFSLTVIDEGQQYGTDREIDQFASTATAADLDR